MKHLLTAIACCLAVAGSAQTWNPDADFDNVIGVNDLMALLSVFGSEWTAEYPQDPEYDLAAYYAGEFNLVGCIQACNSNNARVINFAEYSIFGDSADFSMGYTEDMVCEGYADWTSNDNIPTTAYLSLDSEFGYGVITRGSTGMTCVNDLAYYSYQFAETRLYSITHSGHAYGNAGAARHCFCTGLIPAVE